MDVSELSAEQLAELRETYFHDLQDAGLLEGKQAPFQIPISKVMKHYEGIYFVDEDFFCSMDT